MSKDSRCNYMHHHLDAATEVGEELQGEGLDVHDRIALARAAAFIAAAKKAIAGMSIYSPVVGAP